MHAHITTLRNSPQDTYKNTLSSQQSLFIIQCVYLKSYGILAIDSRYKYIIKDL